MVRLEDLKLYMNDNDCIVGKNKDDKVYALSFKTGELHEVNHAIDPMWGGCPLEYAKDVQRKIKAKIAAESNA